MITYDLHLQTHVTLGKIGLYQHRTIIDMIYV